MNIQKPTLINVIAWTTLASGIVNLFWGLGLALTGLISIVGIVCIPILILPTILGVFEIIYAAKLLSNPPQPMQPSTNLAIAEIVAILAGNVFSVVVGILSLVFYNDQIVKDYFARLNGTLPPEPFLPPVVPVPPVPPAPIVDPVQYPVVEEESASFEEPTFPESDKPEDPEKL
ncbi:MAG: hypothetical protein ABI621_18620 [Chloroflexota bacterium]